MDSNLKFNIEVPIERLKAVHYFTNVKPDPNKNHYDGLVRLQHNGQTGRLTATNGHVVATTTWQEFRPQEQVQFLLGDDLDIRIPINRVAAALKEVDKYHHTISITENAIGRSLYEPHESLMPYPDIVAVAWPKPDTPRISQTSAIDPKYYALLGKAAKALALKAGDIKTTWVEMYYAFKLFPEWWIPTMHCMSKQHDKPRMLFVIGPVRGLIMGISRTALTEIPNF